jgi:hypothetical protein
MFSIDYPHDEMPQGSAWFDGLDLPQGLHRQVDLDNAARLLSLEGRVA